MKIGNNKSNKPVTLYTLAQEMRQGYAAVNEQFEDIATMIAKRLAFAPN